MFCKSRRGEGNHYFFRVLRKKDATRTENWAKAINRINPDGTLWKPSEFSLICSDHFVSGRPSDDPTNPDFVPSIFKHGKNELKVHQGKKPYTCDICGAWFVSKPGLKKHIKSCMHVKLIK